MVGGAPGQLSDLARQRRDAERELTLELQRAMLPPGLPVLPELSLAAVYLPAGAHQAAGGDWFDVVAMPEGTLGLVVGDVVGHGAAAAAVMGQLRAIAAERLLCGAGVVEVARALDVFAASSPAAQGSTVSLAVVDRRTGSIEYGVRGHPAPLVVARDGTSEYLPVAAGPPLAFAAGEFRAARTSLRAGDTLVLYSDGVVARPGRAMAQGMADFAACATEVVRRNADGERGVPAAICAAVANGLIDTQTSHDDVSVLATTVLSGPPAPLAVSVPATADQLGPVRKRIASWLGELRAGEEDLIALELSVVEAVTNSIEHAYDGLPGTVRVDAALDEDGAIGVAVTDDGRWKPQRHDPGFRGRGLVMMRELSDRMRVDTSVHGTTVTLVRTLRQSVSPNGHTPTSAARRHEETDLAVDVRVDDDGVVVAVAGPVDYSSVDRLHGHLLDVGRRGSLPVTLVLDEVTMLASAGVRTLHQQAAEFRAAGRTLRIVAAHTSPARDALAVSGLDELVEVLP